MLEDFIKAYDVEYPCGIVTLCKADSVWNNTDSTLYVGEACKIPKKIFALDCDGFSAKIFRMGALDIRSWLNLQYKGANTDPLYIFRKDRIK